MQSEVSRLTSRLKAISALAERSENYSALCRDEMVRAECLEARLRALDSVANKMVGWAHPLEVRADFMTDISKDPWLLKRHATELVEEVLKGGQNNLIQVCWPLKILIRSGS
jgi:hypothetical protein